MTIGYLGSGEPVLARGAVSYPRSAVTTIAEHGLPSSQFVGLIATDAPTRPGSPAVRCSIRPHGSSA